MRLKFIPTILSNKIQLPQGRVPVQEQFKETLNQYAGIGVGKTPEMIMKDLNSSKLVIVPKDELEYLMTLSRCPVIPEGVASEQSQTSLKKIWTRFLGWKLLKPKEGLRPLFEISKERNSKAPRLTSFGEAPSRYNNDVKYIFVGS